MTNRRFHRPSQSSMTLERVNVVHVMTFHGFRQNGTATNVVLIRERQPYSHQFFWIVSNDGVRKSYGRGFRGRADAISAYEKLIQAFLDGQKG